MKWEGGASASVDGGVGVSRGLYNGVAGCLNAERRMKMTRATHNIDLLVRHSPLFCLASVTIARRDGVERATAVEVFEHATPARHLHLPTKLVIFMEELLIFLLELANTNRRRR